MVPRPSPQLSPKLVTPSITNGDVTFLHSPSNLNCLVPTISPLELVLSRLICFELSAFASKFKACYSCRKPVVRKSLPVSLVDTFYRPLIISFLSVLPLSLYANLCLVLQSTPWRVDQLLGLCKLPLFLHPLEGVGLHHQSIKPFQK